MKKLNYLLMGTALLGTAITVPAQLLINGAGATFPYPLYSKWFDEYAKIDPSVRLNYRFIGSRGGQKQILAQTVDFGPRIWSSHHVSRFTPHHFFRALFGGLCEN
jgi:phosphate transport system substrate-binding protein